jgi:spoIIIJ-associated protein
VERESIETTAKTVEDAIELGLRELDAERDEVEIDVVSKGKSSILGIGGEPARVRVTLLDFEEDETGGDTVRVVSKVLNTLLDLMDVDAVATLKRAHGDNDSGPVFDVDGDDSGLLIGRKGESLKAIQFLVNFISTVELGERPNAVVDVSGYQERRDDALYNLARNIAQRVTRSGRSVSLEPMSPYERRLIHIALADNERVFTQSTGEGPDRRVVVSPSDEEPY